MKSKKKILKNILILVILIYAIITIIRQQNTLNQYENNSQSLASQINEQKEYKEQLAKKQEAINSEEVIEELAREKLDMYLPNEKVYMDTGM